MAEKRYLDSEGVKVLVRLINTGLAGKMDIQEGQSLMTAEEKAKLAELQNYILPIANADTAGGVKVGEGLAIDENGNLSVEAIDWSDVQNVPNDLVHSDELNSAIDEINDKLADAVSEEGLADYAKVEDLNELKDSLSTVYHFRGSVETLEDLANVENPAVGDVYNILSNGMNVGWTGEVWDEFGSTVDLEPYILDEEVQSISLEELNAIIYGGKRVAVSDVEGINMMLANDQPEVEISVTENISNAAIAVPAGKKVTMKLGSNAIETSNVAFDVSGDLVLEGGEVSGPARTVVVREGGSLTINGTEIVSSRDCAISAVAGDVTVNKGTITAQEAGIIATGAANVTINGGTIEGKDNFAVGGNGSNGLGGTTININGGKLISNIQSAGYVSCAVYHPNEGVLNITGGELISTNGCGVLMRGGQLNMSGGSIVATGAPGSLGKVGDSKVTVGPYAIVYDQKAHYPAAASLGIAYTGGELQGTDGKLSVLVDSGVTPNISGLEF